MSNRARLSPMDAKATFSALDRLVGDHSLTEVPVEELPLDRIRPNPRQPRDRESEAFSDSSLDELADSIRSHGVLQPILVRNTGRYYQIVAGERRYRACQKLGLPSVPARVLEIGTEEEELEVSLVENLQRQNLAPLEEAKIYRQMIDELGYTYRSLAERIGKSLGYIDTRLKLLAYDDVREAVQHLNIGVGEARELARVEDDELRQDLIRRVAEGSMDRGELQQTVRDVVSQGLGSREGEGEREGRDSVRLCFNRLRRSLEMALGALDELAEAETVPDWDAGMLQLLQVVAERAEAVVGQVLSGDAVGPGESEEPETAEVEEESRGEETAEAAPEVEEVTGERRRVIEFAKSFRNASNLATLELISKYWTALERRGYTFHLGHWSAKSEGGAMWRVFLAFAIDGQQYTAEWICDTEDGTMNPVNTPARVLLGQRG